MIGVRRALVLSSSERYVNLALSFGQMAIVSRILSPNEIGIAVIGLAVVTIVITAREFASGAFLIQHQNLRHEDIRSTFTILLALTVAILAVLLAGSPVVAHFYGEPGLVRFFMVICGALLIEVVSSLLLALMRREFAFDRVALVSISATASGVAVTIVLALLGGGYMSFAWGWVATAVVASGLCLFLRPDLSIFVPCLAEWRGMVAFGGFNGGNILLLKVFEQVPYLVLARTASPAAAAVFNRGSILATVPDRIALSGVAAVALPAFAAARRDGRSLEEPYLHSLSLVTGLMWPALLVVAILAFPLIDLLLGPQWEQSAEIARILCLAGLFSCAFDINVALLVASGAIRDVFLRSLIVYPLGSVAIALAAMAGGLTAVAWTVVLIAPLHALVSFHFVRQRLAIFWPDLLRAVRPSALVALLSIVGPVAVVMLAGGPDLSLLEGTVAALLAVPGWLLGIRLGRHPMREELGLLVDLIQRQRLVLAERGLGSADT
jgi:O-antigen/teichoic acid export membrane protein